MEKLRDFYGSLSEPEQAMLETVLESAQAGDTGGYAAIWSFDAKGLVDWIENQGEGDTQGFAARFGF